MLIRLLTDTVEKILKFKTQVKKKKKLNGYKDVFHKKPFLTEK